MLSCAIDYGPGGVLQSDCAGPGMSPLWPGRCCNPSFFLELKPVDHAMFDGGTRIQVFDVIHQFIDFFELRRICNCCNNIFNDLTTILNEQQRYWAWEIRVASINAQMFRSTPGPSICRHTIHKPLRDYICCHRTIQVGDSIARTIACFQ